MIGADSLNRPFLVFEAHTEGSCTTDNSCDSSSKRQQQITTLFKRYSEPSDEVWVSADGIYNPLSLTPSCKADANDMDSCTEILNRLFNKGSVIAPHYRAFGEDCPKSPEVEGKHDLMTYTKNPLQTNRNGKLASYANQDDRCIIYRKYFLARPPSANDNETPMTQISVASTLSSWLESMNKVCNSMFNGFCDRVIKVLN